MTNAKRAMSAFIKCVKHLYDCNMKQTLAFINCMIKNNLQKDL